MVESRNRKADQQRLENKWEAPCDMRIEHDVAIPSTSGPGVRPTQSKGTVTADNGIVVLAPDTLFALQNLIELDGRVAAFPAQARGYAPINCYLLKHGNRFLMLDTGFKYHREDILRQLTALTDAQSELTLFPLRMNEFMSLSNTMSIATHFKVAGCLSVLRDAAYHVDLESLDEAHILAANQHLKTILISGNEQLFVGDDGARPIQLFQSPIRLIATRWVYDPLTRTLFTSDMFSGLWGADQNEQWIVSDSESDTTTVDDVASFLLNTRYWWLEGAGTDKLRRGLASIFEKYDIETIAPGYGKILSGRAVVTRHYNLLDAAIRRLDRSRTAGRYVGREEVR
jgi:hypothetical protein